MHLLSAHREQADFYRLGAVVFQVEDEFQGFVLRWVLCEVDVVSICFGSENRHTEVFEELGFKRGFVAIEHIS